MAKSLGHHPKHSTDKAVYPNENKNAKSQSNAIKLKTPAMKNNKAGLLQKPKRQGHR